MDKRYAFLVTTWSGPKLVETISYLPHGDRLLVVDGSQHGWPLSKQWNYGINRLCHDEAFEAVIVMNDDVVFRQDTAELLYDALKHRQFAEPHWTERELLLISARHAAPSDAMTDAPDWKLLKTAKPRLQPGPDFSTFITSLKLFREVGEFDEGFNPAYFEDNDMHRRIILAGYEAGAYAPYWHYRSATYRYDIQRRLILQGGAFEQSKRHYIEKWGGPPASETYLTPYNR